MKQRPTLLIIVILALVGFVLWSQTQPKNTAPPAINRQAENRRGSASPHIETGFGQPQIGAVRGSMPILKDVSVLDFGRIVYQGDMDLNPTIDRIRRGEKLSHRNDGGIFTNRERRLPSQGDRNYYREFVHKMKGFSFPGPQRVIIGKDGSVWYTGDHYATFVQVNK
jgi:hypothetical protein